MPITESLSATKERENARDRALMARSASGEREALEELFKLYNESIYHSSLRICRNADDAIEATQEAFLTVFRRMREHYAGISSFRDYLFTASRNASLKTIAKRRRAIPTEDMPEPNGDGFVNAYEDPERSLLIDEQQQMVHRASERLSDRQLEALKMYELDGLDYSRIGHELGLEPNAVAQLISRARQRLRTEVRFTSTAKESSTEICTKAMALMPKKVDRTLTKREATWLEPHIAGCDICKTNLNVMEEVGTSYRSLLPPSALIFELIFRDDALAKLYPSLSDASAPAVVNSTGGVKLFMHGRRLFVSFLVLGVTLAVGVSSSGPGVAGTSIDRGNTFSDAAAKQQVAYAGIGSGSDGSNLVEESEIASNEIKKGTQGDASQPNTVPTVGIPGSLTSEQPTADASPINSGPLSVIDPTTGFGGEADQAGVLGAGDGSASTSSSKSRRRTRNEARTASTRRTHSSSSRRTATVNTGLLSQFYMVSSGSGSSVKSSNGRRRSTGSKSRSSKSTKSGSSGRGTSSGSSSRSGSMPPSLTIPGTGTSGSTGTADSGSAGDTSSGSSDSGSGTSDTSRSGTDTSRSDSDSGSRTSDGSTTCDSRTCTDSDTSTRR